MDPNSELSGAVPAAADVADVRFLDRARGVMVGVLVGDCLGGPFERSSWEEVRELELGRSVVDLTPANVRYYPGIPLGTYQPGGDGGFRECRGVWDGNWVGVGLVMEELSDEHWQRYGGNKMVTRADGTTYPLVKAGYYTDDSCAALGVAKSLVEQQGLTDSQLIGEACAEFGRSNPFFRGCPPTAKQVQEAILGSGGQAKVSVNETGLPPHFDFDGGSFANGGGMRISPLAVPYVDVSTSIDLKKAVIDVCWPTHRHPEAQDFAFLQAFSVQHALKLGRDQEEWNSERYLSALREQKGEVEGNDMRVLLDQLVSAVSTAVEQVKGYLEQRQITGAEEESTHEHHWNIMQQVDVPRVRGLIAPFPRPGSSFEFQINSLHAAATVFYLAARYIGPDYSPVFAIAQAIRMGGDSDTTASMVGGIAGAYYGAEAFRAVAGGRLYDGLENGEAEGRDYAIRLAEQLAHLKVREYEDVNGRYGRAGE